MAMGNIPVALIDKDGNEHEAHVFHGTLALNTLQELGKVNKIVEDKGSSGNVQVHIDVGGLLGETPVADVIEVEINE